MHVEILPVLNYDKLPLPNPQDYDKGVQSYHTGSQGLFLLCSNPLEFTGEKLRGDMRRAPTLTDNHSIQWYRAEELE